MNWCNQIDWDFWYLSAKQLENVHLSIVRQTILTGSLEEQLKKSKNQHEKDLMEGGGEFIYLMLYQENILMLQKNISHNNYKRINCSNKKCELF